MPNIFIMCGLPFSGKSTLSKQIAISLGIPRISFDETWIQVEQEHGSVPGLDDIERWKYINRMCEDNARKLLSEGSSVVYDNLGSNFDQRDKIKKLAGGEGATSKVIYIDIDKEEAIRRREANLELKERAQVSDQNFDRALATFEPPERGEDALVYRSFQDVNTWIETEINKRKGVFENE